MTLRDAGVLLIRVLVIGMFEEYDYREMSNSSITGP